MILLVDNYDSFAYNLYQLIGMIDNDIKVIRNDELSISEIEGLNPSFIVLSPGPGRPINAGLCIDIVNHFEGKVPILGVCLGHQSICEAYGGIISYSKQLMHGKTSDIVLDTNSLVFKNMDPVINVGRYHSLSILENTLPSELKVIAKSEDGEIMAIEHVNYPIYGVQFHPESILTPDGLHIMENFLKNSLK